MAASGRVRASATVKSNRSDWQTRGTFVTPTSKPMPRSSRYRMTPPAASSPKALPPASTMAWMTCAAACGLSNSLSREAGPPPRTSSPAGAPSLPSSTTVQPVPAAVFSTWPIWRLSKDVMGISFMGVSFPRMPLYRILIDHCTPPAPPAQQKIPPGVRPRRDGKVRGYSNSIVAGGFVV